MGIDKEALKLKGIAVFESLKEKYKEADHKAFLIVFGVGFLVTIVSFCLISDFSNWNILHINDWIDNGSSCNVFAKTHCLSPIQEWI